MTDEKGLNLFGIANEDCKILRVQENSWIDAVAFSYNDNGITRISFATNDGDNKASGE